jgi:Flp pilus assembly protein CpaB
MDRRKQFLLFGAAWLSALLLTWFYYSNAVAPKREKTLRMVVATHDMPIGTLLKKSDLKIVNYPEKDVPKGSVFQIASAENRVLMVPLNTNEPVLVAKLSDMTSVEIGRAHV